MKTVTLLATALVTGAGAAFQSMTDKDRRIMANQGYQATVEGTGSVSATVLIEVSNDKVSWVTAQTFSLTGTTKNSQIAALVAPYQYRRANVTAISGTGAAVTVTMAV